jgi:hypothetical protein
MQILEVVDGRVGLYGDDVAQDGVYVKHLHVAWYRPVSHCAVAPCFLIAYKSLLVECGNATSASHTITCHAQTLLCVDGTEHSCQQYTKKDSSHCFLGTGYLKNLTIYSAILIAIDMKQTTRKGVRL